MKVIQVNTSDGHSEINVGPNLAQKAPPTNKCFTSFLNDRNDNSLFLIPTDTSEIKRVVNNLNNKMSAGQDGISNIVLKNIVDEILIPLEYIFNLSLVNGIVPEKMKIARVVPVF